MQRWEILLNGSPYSHQTSNLRSKKHANTILETWFHEMKQRKNAIPAGNYQAVIYSSSFLDKFGN